MVRRSRRNASERFNGDPDRRSRQASRPRRSSVGLKKQSQRKLAGVRPASFSWLSFFSPRIYPGERETRNAKRETRNAKRETRNAGTREWDAGSRNDERKTETSISSNTNPETSPAAQRPTIRTARRAAGSDVSRRLPQTPRGSPY